MLIAINPMFQTLIGRIETKNRVIQYDNNNNMFQTLIGRIETSSVMLGLEGIFNVSNPYR